MKFHVDHAVSPIEPLMWNNPMRASDFTANEGGMQNPEKGCCIGCCIRCCWLLWLSKWTVQWQWPDYAGISSSTGATAFAQRFAQRLVQRALQRVAEDLEVIGPVKPRGFGMVQTQWTYVDWTRCGMVGSAAKLGS